MRFSRFILFALACALALPASAAAPRVFVSGAGTDIGTCPISAPCRNFAYAVLQVNPGGEVIALDTAGYGPVTITTSLSLIAAPGATAFVAAASGVGITVNAGSSDIVTLRGLAVTSTGGTHGIAFAAGQALNVENCLVNGFSVAGVLLQRPSDMGKPRLQIVNTVLRNNGDGVTVLNPGPGNFVYATITNSAFTGQTNNGVDAVDNARITIADTVFAGNSNGVLALAGADGAASEVNLDRCTISRNGIGVRAGGSGSNNPRGIVRLANCLITTNDTGVSNAGDGAILSRVSNGVLTNTIDGNSTDGLTSVFFLAQ